MALSINIYDPFQTPTLDSVSRSAGGGNWAAGTYEFKIFSLYGNMATRPLWRSAASNSQTLAVSANDSVTFNYTIPTETGTQPTYILFLSRISGSGAEWDKAVYDSGAYAGISLGSYPSSFTSSVQGTGSATQQYTINENFTINGEEFFGLDTDKGTYLIDITGSSGTIDLGDIITAVQSSGMTSGVDYLAFGSYALFTIAGISAKSATGGTIDLTNAMIHTLAGFSNEGSDLTVASTRTDNMIPILACAQMGGNCRNISLDNCDIDGFLIHLGVNAPLTLSRPQYEVLSGTYKNGMVNSYYDTIYADVFKDTILTFLNASARFFDSGTYDELTVLCSYIYVRSDKSSIVQNCIIKTSRSAYQVFWLPNDVNNYVRFRDTIFKNQSTEAVIPYGDLGFWDHNNYSKNCHIDFENSFNFFVQGEDGNPIEDAVISMTDKNGDVVINNETTDTDGLYSQYVLVFKHENITTEPAGYGIGVNTLLSPFAITIQKNGLEIESFPLSNVSEAQNLTVTLKPASNAISIYVDQEQL